MNDVEKREMKNKRKKWPHFAKYRNCFEKMGLNVDFKRKWNYIDVFRIVLSLIFGWFTWNFNKYLLQNSRSLSAMLSTVTDQQRLYSQYDRMFDFSHPPFPSSVVWIITKCLFCQNIRQFFLSKKKSSVIKSSISWRWQPINTKRHEIYARLIMKVKSIGSIGSQQRQ